MGTWMSLVNRILFLAAFLLLAIAILERLVNYFGYTILFGGYTSGRMLDFAGTMLLFVIALLLREMRDDLRKKVA